MFIEINLPWKNQIESPKKLDELFKISGDSSNLYTNEQKEEAAKEYHNIYNQWRKNEKETSFYPLAIPGTVIQYNNKKGELVTELIGNLNCNGGYCDDCHIPYETIILRYKVIDWE